MSTPVPHLDLPLARELVNRAIDEKGADYVYNVPVGENETCLYFRNGKPDCLIGHVLHYLGIDQGCVREGESAGGVLISLRGQNKLTFTSEAADYLSAAQGHQDNGKPWGAARDYAEEQVNEN